MEQKVINCPHCGKIISKDALAGKKTASVKCPKCGSQRNFKDGMRQTRTGRIQLYRCRNCGYRFSKA